MATRSAREPYPCTEEDPELFFSGDRSHIRQAKEMCASCPVIKQCLRAALENNETGVWGGTTTNERRKIKVAQRQDEVLERAA